MIIKRIKLHNIRSYRDEDIELKNGTLLFEGDIGSGKTSLLMAIEFALFGTTEGGFYDKILRKGANEGFAEIAFVHEGDEYIIYRSLKKKGKGIRGDESYVLTPKGKKILSPSEIKSYILGLMGVRVSVKKRKSLPIITYAIYTPQETMKNILGGGDEERMEVIRRIFKLDDYKIARDNTNIIKNNIKVEVKSLERRREDLENIKREIENLNNDIISLEKEIKRLLNEKNIEERKLKDMEKNMEEWEKKRKRYIELTKREENLKTLLNKFMDDIKKDKNDLKDIEKKRERAKEIEADARRYESITKEIEKMKEDIEKLHELEKELRGNTIKINIIKEKSNKLKNWKNEIKEKYKRIDELKEYLKGRDKIENDFDEANRKLQFLFGAIEHNKKKMEELENERKEYESLGAVCPKCKRPLTKEHKEKLIREVEEKIEEIRGNINKISAKIKKIEEERENLKEKIDDFNRKENILAGLSKEYSMLKKRIEEEEEEIRAGGDIEGKIEKEKEEIEKLKIVEKEYLSLEKERKRLEKIWREYIRLSSSVEELSKIKSRIEEENNKIKEFEGNILDIEGKIKSLNFSEEEYKKVEEEYRRIREKLSGIETGIRDKKNYLEEKRDEMKIKEEEKIKIERDIEWGEKLSIFNSWIEEKFIPSLEDIERSALMSINEQFRVLFERWFNELLGESDYDATIDEDFKPVVRYEKYDMSISTLSGGERTSVALAYRLALNSMIKRALGLKTNILILDEPTDGFSKDQLYKLKDILAKMETDQIIIVSHEKELENIADSIYLVEKKNGLSKVKVI